jgi:DNA-binding SARP family transcriptional activator
MIACRTLGPVEVMVDDAAARPELLWRKHLALLIYLARSAPRPRTREHLSGLLWPDKPEEAARHSLVEATRVLRRHLGESAVQTVAGQVRLSSGAVGLDLDEFAAAMRRGDWEAATGLVSGEFMEGFVIPGASQFEDWLAAERAHWRAQSVEALFHRADQLERAGLAAEGAEHALRALQLDSRSERALRSALKCLALSGDRTAALERYEEFRLRLAKDFGARPDGESAALADRIRHGRDNRPPSPADAGASTRRWESRVPLVGRETELARLWLAAAAARTERRAAALVVEGDAGNGKSRLLEELTARLQLEGMTVVSARAVEADREDACGGVLALLRGGLLEAPGIAGAPARALAALAGALPEWEERFPGVIAAGETLPLVRALLEVVRAASEERPVVVAVDDAHWLDRESVLALGAALRDLDASPFVLAVALQPGFPRAELDEIRSHIGRDLGGAYVSLGVLGRDALRSLASHFLPGYTEVELDRVSRRVATDSAGVPFLAVELFRAVASGLDLASVSGAWPEEFRTLDQTLPGDLPQAVVASLRVTFRRLSPSAQAVLAAASVIGDRTEAGVLALATELPVREVRGALDELEWHRWLVADARGYAFAARIAREVISRDMVLEGQRGRIIAAAGQTTHSTIPSNPGGGSLV